MAETLLGDVGVLIVEDDALLRRQLQAYLERAGAEVTAVADLASARHALESLAFEFALIDVNLPDGRGIELLEQGRFSPNTSVVVMTGEGGIGGAVEAMRLGARDYLTKPFEPGELPLVFGRVRRHRQTQRIEEHRREDESPRDDEFVFGSALGPLHELLERILAADRRMQSGLAPVLVQGETGTGKTSIARWLHHRGPRSAQPLVEVNCSAFPEALAESELFGHERGAFTDARAARMGLFEAAQGGTLFMDELASLSLPIQAKVLTAIEDGRIRRVGGNRPIVIDVRIIAAANVELRDLVAQGRFREDLLHRLDLFRVLIPPLRERRADIVPLAEALMRRACRRHRLEPREILPEGRQRLETYNWPGNVRELSHELERALVFEDGPLSFVALRNVREVAAAPAPPATGKMMDWFNPAFRFPNEGFSLDAATERLVRHALWQSAGNVSGAARLLGVSRDVVRYRVSGRGTRRGDDSPTPPTDEG